MEVTPLAIPEVLLFKPRVFEDERGYFLESFNAKTFETCEVKLKDAEATLNEIRLNKIGKKIKVINDNPG